MVMVVVEVLCLEDKHLQFILLFIPCYCSFTNLELFATSLLQPLHPPLLTDRLYIEVTLLTGIRSSESITERFVHKDCLRLQL